MQTGSPKEAAGLYEDSRSQLTITARPADVNTVIRSVPHRRNIHCAPEQAILVQGQLVQPIVPQSALNNNHLVLSRSNTPRSHYIEWQPQLAGATMWDFNSSYIAEKAVRIMKPYISVASVHQTNSTGWLEGGRYEGHCFHSYKMDLSF